MSKRRSIKPNDYESLADKYKKKYPSYIRVLENSPLQRARQHGINEYDIVGMCRQLDQFLGMCRMFESNSSMANLDQLPRIGLSVISANFGISPIALFCGVQPIPEEIGIIWFEDFKANSTRGNVTSGQTLIGSKAGPDVYPDRFAGDSSRQASIVTTGTNGNHATYSNITLPDSILGMDPYRLKVYGSTKFNTDADAVVWPQMIPDPKTGVFGGAAKVNGTTYTIYGVFNYATNVLTALEFSATPSSAVLIQADFAVLQEAATDISGAIIQMQSMSVQTEFYALKSIFGLFQQYVANQRWGMNLEDEMTKKLIQALNVEVCNRALQRLISNVPTDNVKDPFVREPGTGIDYISHKLAIPDYLTEIGKLLTKKAQRGHVNVWIAGLSACTVLETLPGFTKTFDDSTFGPHVYGNYRGATVIRVPDPMQMDEDLIIGVYKGDSPFEAPVVYCPFMPLTVTDVLIQGSNPLQYQKAACQGAAIESIIPSFSCSGKIDQTGFNFASL